MYYYAIFIGFDLQYVSFPHIICILGLGAWTSRLHLKVKIKNEILSGRRASGDEDLQIQITCGWTTDNEIRQDKADYIQHVTTSLLTTLFYYCIITRMSPYKNLSVISALFLLLKSIII